MSSTVCQGLQSCLESRLVEQRALVLKLVPPRPQIFKEPKTPTPRDEEKCNQNDKQNDSGASRHITKINGQDRQNLDRASPLKQFASKEDQVSTWNSIQSLGTNLEPKQSLYTPSLSNRSSLTLNNKSLELCTENLGCETGTDITQSSPFSSSSSCSSLSSSSYSCGEALVGGTRGERRVRKKEHQIPMYKRDNNKSFPPPLTSLAGQDCIHVRSHRENGRLVLRTITLPSSQTCFKAERSEGRLTLRFSNQYSTTTHEEEQVYNDVDVGEKEREEQEQEQEEEEHEEEKGNDDLGRGRDDGEDMNGNEINGGGEMGIEKFQRPSRCKEGGQRNKEILIWEPLWVASS
ncbi:protein FANTASTIC FOUR 3-like [Tasmannia lanceolata]|uniref:protein FANTASTIC FOUR 3-like n=1 Tax=Tasmannia lanceolata TaxID=3420 RepID=UPI004064C7BC